MQNFEPMNPPDFLEFHEVSNLLADMKCLCFGRTNVVICVKRLLKVSGRFEADSRLSAHNSPIVTSPLTRA
jgi:hypothetical protein